MVTRAINERTCTCAYQSKHQYEQRYIAMHQQVECVDVSETILDVGIDSKLGKTQNFAAQMKRVSFSSLSL